MSGKSMDVFSLRDSIIGEYRKFATSFTTIHAEDIRAQVEAIYSEGRFWPDPLIQINPSYKRGLDLETLIANGALDPRTAEIFRADGAPLSLYKHQAQAVVLASQGESYVVTTGTGSGKSLCFFIPIVSAVLAEKRKSPARRTRAIIIYPMNALANSQLEELDKFVANVQGEKPITFERYTGQEDAEKRRSIADKPPDILLTNFMMLELLMTRQDELDRKVIGNCQGLRFLVLDELHTYRGRQGADVALLVRRVRERLSPEKLQCIGTSATMASEGSVRNKQEVVASVASKLFATTIDPSHVIIEELERVTDKSKRAESVRSALGSAIDAERRLAQFFADYNEGRAHMGIDGLTPADRFFGRADRVLAAVDAISRKRQGALALLSPPGAPIEELTSQAAGGPLEVLRLVLIDGVMELRFCGARIRLGRVEG